MSGKLHACMLAQLQDVCHAAAGGACGCMCRSVAALLQEPCLLQGPLSRTMTFSACSASIKARMQSTPLAAVDGLAPRALDTMLLQQLLATRDNMLSLAMPARDCCDSRAVSRAAALPSAQALGKIPTAEAHMVRLSATCQLPCCLPTATATHRSLAARDPRCQTPCRNHP